jgi:hypothetical protein
MHHLRGNSSQQVTIIAFILEDFADEFHMDSSGEGSSGFPISQRRSMCTPPDLITTTPWPDPPQTIALWPDTGLPPE